MYAAREDTMRLRLALLAALVLGCGDDWRGASLARAVEAARVARCRHEASAFGAPFFDTRRELWAAEAVTRDALAALALSYGRLVALASAVGLTLPATAAEVTP